MSTVSVKLTYETRQVLRLITAYTDETIQEIMERLAHQEWKKVQEGQDGLPKAELHPSAKRSA